MLLYGVNMSNDHKKSKNSYKESVLFAKAKALKITVLYMLIGSAWIILSDLLSQTILQDASKFMLTSILKGLLYVIVTGFAIYLMIFKALKETDMAKQDAESSNEELKKSNLEYKNLYIENSNRQFLIKSLTDSMPDHIFYKDINFRYTGCNKAFAEFHGMTEKEIIGKNDYQIFSKDFADTYVESDKDVINNLKKAVFEDIAHRGDSVTYFETIKNPYFDANGNCVGLIGVSRDITERKVKQDQIIYLNHHDILTGLYNRLYLENAYAEIDKKENLPISIIIGDINGLKLVNDSLGHGFGDMTIKEIADILSKCCSDKGVVARIGGDEFVILLPKTDNKTAYDLIKQITHDCNEHMNDMKSMFYANISLGCATKSSMDDTLEKVYQQAEENMYRQKMFEYKSQHSAILSSIKKTMFEKSYETEEHAERMAVLSRKLGKEVGLPEEELIALELLSNLHDIGKISIDKNILTKPGKLSKEEWKEIKKHPEVGYRITQVAPDLMHISEYILSHHERWDGLGYPQGLKEKEIPLLSRIIAVVDSYDAMTQDRPYSKAKTKLEAKEEILANAGSQFDPIIAKIFVEKVLN